MRSLWQTHNPSGASAKFVDNAGAAELHLNGEVVTSSDNAVRQAIVATDLAAMGLEIFVSGLVANDTGAAAANYTAIQAALDTAGALWDGKPFSPQQTVVLPAGKTFYVSQTAYVSPKTKLDLNGSTLTCTGANGFPPIYGKNAPVTLTSVAMGNTGATNPQLKAYAATTAYAVGDHVVIGNYTYQAIVAGTTGSTNPWSDMAGTIASATKASPGVFTENAHGRRNGEIIRISGATGTGWTAINDDWLVAGVTTNTYQLRRRYMAQNWLTTTVFNTMYPLLDTTSFGTLGGTIAVKRLHEAVLPIAGDQIVDGTVVWRCLGRGYGIVTATLASHNRMLGDYVEVSGSTNIGFSGSVIIFTDTTANTFKYLATAPVAASTTESTGLQLRGDRDIAVVNGAVDCQYPTLTAVADGPASHGLVFENITGLLCEDIRVINVQKYGIYVLHWTRIKLNNITSDGAVCAWQVEGPGGFFEADGAYGTVQGSYGNVLDDLCAFGCGNTWASYPAQLDSGGTKRHTHGDIYSVRVANVNPTTNTQHQRIFGTMQGRVNFAHFEDFNGYTDTNVLGIISDAPYGQGACFVDNLSGERLSGFTTGGDVNQPAPSGRLGGVFSIAGTAKVNFCTLKINQGATWNAVMFGSALPQGVFNLIGCNLRATDANGYPVGLKLSDDSLPQDIQQISVIGGNMKWRNGADTGIVSVTDGSAGNRIRNIAFDGGFHAESDTWRKGLFVDFAYGLVVDSITFGATYAKYLRSVIEGQQYQGVVRTSVNLGSLCMEDCGRISRTVIGYDLNCGAATFKITSAQAGNYGAWGVFWDTYDGSHAVNSTIVGDINYIFPAGSDPYVSVGMANSVAGHTYDIKSNTITADPSLNTIILPTKNNRCISIATGTNKQGLALAVNGTNWYALGTGASGINTLIV